MGTMSREEIESARHGVTFHLSNDLGPEASHTRMSKARIE